MSDDRLDATEIHSAGTLRRTGTNPSRELAQRPPRLKRIRMGEYVESWRWSGLDDAEHHRALVVATARRTRGAEQVWSHQSAGAIWRMPAIGGWPRTAQVTMPADAAGSSAVITRHRMRRMPRAVEHDGLLVTSPARTVVDIARTRPLACALAAADWTVASGLCSLAEIDDEVDAIEVGGRGRRAARLMQLLVDPRAESPGESLSRARMYELGFAQPDLQVLLADTEGTFGRADFGWTGVIGEFDGERKYRATGDAGETASEEVVISEKRREDRARRLGLAVGRWVWAEAFPDEAPGMVDALRAAGVPRDGSAWSAYPRDQRLSEESGAA
ncbi:hypothetical protein [Flexivirga sp. B27]